LPFSFTTSFTLGSLGDMISSVIMLLLAIYCQGSTDETQPTEMSSVCQCPAELPWPSEEIYLNTQELCGKELMYMVSNTKCEKESIYNCKVNETVPEFQKNCGRGFCIPSFVKDCTYNKELSENCLRNRACHEERVMKKKMENAYGKNWRQKFNYYT